MASLIFLFLTEPWETNHHNQDSLVVSGESSEAAWIGPVLIEVVADLTEFYVPN
jgi:hypothetical protein